MNRRERDTDIDIAIHHTSEIYRHRDREGVIHRNSQTETEIDPNRQLEIEIEMKRQI